MHTHTHTTASQSESGVANRYWMEHLAAPLFLYRIQSLTREAEGILMRQICGSREPTHSESTHTHTPRLR